MIIEYTLEQKIKEKRELDIKKFDNNLDTILKSVYPTIIFRITGDYMIIKDIPIIYVDSIKNTLEYILKNLDLLNKNNGSENNEDSLIKLMFKSFSLEETDKINSFLTGILEIKIEYKEDLFFYFQSYQTNLNQENNSKLQQFLEVNIL